MTKKTKVLIGDDSRDFGIAAADALRGMGFFCITRPKDGGVLFDAVKGESPDVAVLDLSMPNLDAIELMKKLGRTAVRRPVFIVTSPCDNPFAERQAMQAGASYFLIRPFEPKMLGDRINEILGYDLLEDAQPAFSPRQDLSPEVTVTKMIHQLGVPAHIKGYHYLRSAILHCIEDSEMLECVTKLLYPTVASEFQTTPSRVERAIRHAIEIAWDRGDVETLNSFFGCTVNTCKGKPTNSEFIALISDRIAMDRRERAKLRPMSAAKA